MVCGLAGVTNPGLLLCHRGCGGVTERFPSEDGAGVYLGVTGMDAWFALMPAADP